MSYSVFDSNNKKDHMTARAFFDDAPTVARYDKVKYAWLEKLTDKQLGFFWRPEEIDIFRDAKDFKGLSEYEQHIFTSNLKRQILLDSVQGRSPNLAFLPLVSIPELETWIETWAFNETIHSRSYTHIIRNIYNVPKDEFNKIHDTQQIVDMASSIGTYYDKLHVLNCRKEAGIEVDEREHIKAIWLALNASYALEALRFMVSFATSLAMVENKIFIGNGNIISLILQDEILHKEWTAWLINQIVKEDPRFAAVKAECEAEVYQIYQDVIKEEKAWADYLFKFGPVIGLNATILRDFVDYTAAGALKEIGIKYQSPAPKSTPIPWFNKHVDTHKKQTALQENESTNYVIGVMSDTVDYEELPDL